ncbi:MAG: indole-3-glycerol phosphate synthase TrpC [Saprospiraceae bacterium]
MKVEIPNILQKIIEHKKIEIEQNKKALSIDALKDGKYYNVPCFDMKTALLEKSKLGIIAEFKHKSPSKHAINLDADVTEVTTGYVQAGVSGLSVLTDNKFFGGSLDDLVAARKANKCPILRKEFIIDEYQIYESKANGADVILLIAECLTKAEITHLAGIAKNIGLQVLCELHDESQIPKLNDNIDIIGVNNRNLKTFEVSIENSIRIKRSLPTNKALISESGISKPEDILQLLEHKFDGFLIGELFMKHNNPGLAAKKLINKVTNTKLIDL